MCVYRRVGVKPSKVHGVHLDHLTRALSARHRASQPIPAPFRPQPQVPVEHPVHCAATEVDALLAQPVDYLLPTAVTVFSPDGEYTPFAVGVHLSAPWPLLGILVLPTKLT